MKLKFTLLTFLFSAFTMIYAQQDQGATYVGTADGHTYVPSLASRMSELTPSTVKPPKEAQDGRSYRIKREVIPGKGRQTDILSQDPHRLNQKIPGRVPDLVWTGATSNSQPTDPSLAVGPDHVFVVFNTGFAIYDKDGNTLVGQTSPNPAIFPSSGCCDLTVSYDPVATSASNPTPGRWVLSFLGGGAQVAVSDGPDPVTSGWNVYNINTINDYQKLSVWSDGYYVSDQSSGNRIYAMERQAMLDGEPAGNVSIQGFTLPNFNNQGFASVQALNISDDQYPAPGNATIIFFQDDAYAGQTDDSIKFWDLDVDFDTPGNSTISAPQEVLVTPFTSIFDGTSFANLAQPNGGADIDALQGIIMNQAQYKKFPTYESAIFNFVIDIDPSGGEQAAIRWYEFRRDTPTDPWVMEQEGTFSDPDGRHFWHGSMIMDTQGNIGMGFSVLGNTATGNGTANEFVSSYYTGRLASDPNGTMTIAPQLIAAGSANIPGLRYGDYSKIDLDPVDYKRMYFINELMFPGRSDVVGRFQVAPDFDTDAGVVDIVAPVDGDLSAPQDVTISVRNFGLNDISNVPVSYTIDGGAPIAGVVPGTITSGATVDYTFTVQADLSIEGQTYLIESSTALPGDEDPGNDSFSKEVKHIAPNDIGVSEITSPTSGEGLGDETVTVTIENFGTADQSGFDVSFSVDGGTPVVETVAATVAAGSTISYSFTQTANLSAIGLYAIEARTLLAGDADPSNNATTIGVQNLPCSTSTNDTNQPIGPNAGTVTESIITVTDDFGIEDVNVTLNLTHTFTGDLDIFLIGPDGTSVELSTDNGAGGDNMIGTIFDDEASSPITGGSAPFTGSFQPEGSLSDFDGLSSAGDWTLSITDDANADGGQLQDWSLQLCSDPILFVEDQSFPDGSELIIVDEGNDQYRLLLNTTSVNNTLLMSVTNMLGQKLSQYPLDNTGNGYEYLLDMSYVASGVYIIRLGDENYSSVKRIVVR
ncbi:proprotein convertase P-domain-containing protein [Patiriisocius hiemis]|uniref:Proprotein convertase P-domain-containing protein n=1 Tax=Patiriisocius hiemis TaxID=3075604 RepID=A0ABU2YE64_9FLAO|nr:proprotein convertase P-domain-containing protein [Constantimarinum sp. W242]MDT0556477.1 proprotein convertase P-domain-containing protein [Constantimarinum sp. W242]